MAWVAGADGCKGGWFRALRETETGELHFDLVERASDLCMRSATRVADSAVGLRHCWAHGTGIT